MTRIVSPARYNSRHYIKIIFKYIEANSHCEMRPNSAELEQAPVRSRARAITTPHRNALPQVLTIQQTSSTNIQQTSNRQDQRSFNSRHRHRFVRERGLHTQPIVSGNRHNNRRGDRRCVRLNQRSLKDFSKSSVCRGFFLFPPNLFDWAKQVLCMFTK